MKSLSTVAPGSKGSRSKISPTELSILLSIHAHGPQCGAGLETQPPFPDLSRGVVYRAISAAFKHGRIKLANRDATPFSRAGIYYELTDLGRADLAFYAERGLLSAPDARLYLSVQPGDRAGRSRDLAEKRGAARVAPQALHAREPRTR